MGGKLGGYEWGPKWQLLGDPKKGGYRQASQHSCP